MASTFDRYTYGGALLSSATVGNSWWERSKLSQSDDDTWFEVTNVYRYRPDLISNTFYGSVEYTWLVRQYNGALDDDFFEVGVIIRLPLKTRVTSMQVSK